MKKLDAKLFFYILVFLNVLLVGATLAVFTLASGAAQKASQKITQAKVSSETDDQLIGYYKVLQGTLNANRDLQSTVAKVLPADKDQSAALNDLSAFGKKDNVTIGQVSFSPGTNKGTGKTLTSPSNIKGVSVISVTLSCSHTRYEDLLAFLKDVETTQRRMQVTTLNITPNGTNPDLLDRIDLSIDIYLKTGT